VGCEYQIKKLAEEINELTKEELNLLLKERLSFLVVIK